MYPLHVGLIPPQLPGSPTALLAKTPDLAKVLLDLGYNTGQFGKNHLGDKNYSLPTAHGFQEFFGYLYHLDAMQGVSFADLNISPTVQGVAPPCANTPVKGLAPVPGAVDPKGNAVCLTPPRPMLSCTSSDGTEENQSCKDEGPLTLKRSETVDEELPAKVVDYLDRHDPKKTGKPFFVWYNPARMHVTTALPEKYMNMVGVKGGKDWGVNEAGMKQLDDNIGVVYAKLEAMGQMDNTIIVFTTDNGAETMTFPDGGITPFKGQKGDSWEGGYRVPMLIRWPGHIKAGVTTNEMMAALDWMPTLAELAGGPTGDGLKKQIEAGEYPGFVKTTLDGVNQAPFLTGKSEHSARDFFFYYSGAQLAAVRWKNWKFVYYGTEQGATGWLMPLIPYHWTMLVNLNRDPFEQAFNDKTAMGFGVRHAIQVDQTGPVLLRGHAAGYGPLLANSDQRQRRYPLAVPSRDRYCPDHFGGDRDTGANDGRWRQAETDRRSKHGLYVRRGQCRRADTASYSILRNDGGSGSIQRRMDVERGSRSSTLATAGQRGSQSCRRVQVRTI